MPQFDPVIAAVERMQNKQLSSNTCSLSVGNPEGTSNGSDICDFLKVSDLNGGL